MKTRLVAICLAVLIVFSLSACSKKGNDREVQEWPTTGILQELPVPPSTKCVIEIETNDRISGKILSITEQDFKNYVAACKEKGFTIDENYSSSIFNAYNAAGYEVDLIFFSNDNELSFFLDAPLQMKPITWPSTEAGKQVPAPKSLVGKLAYSYDDHFRIFVGEMDREAFAEYVKECKKAGFDRNVEEYDDHYSADNANGYHLALIYEGYNTIEIYLEAPEEKEEETIISSDDEITTAPATEELTETSLEPATQTMDTEATTQTVATEPTKIIISTAEESTTTEFENPFQDPGKWTVSTFNDYAHGSDIIILGNNEGVELTIEASKQNLSFDDFFIVYDEELLECVEKTIIDSEKNKTILKYRITHTAPGTSEVYIISMYEYIELGDDCSAYSLTVRGLDKTDGKVVYVTPTGEKYHFSKSCAGENAIATTFWDVRQYEYEPCGKCAQ